MTDIALLYQEFRVNTTAWNCFDLLVNGMFRRADELIRLRAAQAVSASEARKAASARKKLIIKQEAAARKENRLKRVAAAMLAKPPTAVEFSFSCEYKVSSHSAPYTAKETVSAAEQEYVDCGQCSSKVQQQTTAHVTKVPNTTANAQTQKVTPSETVKASSPVAAVKTPSGSKQSTSSTTKQKSQSRKERVSKDCINQEHTANVPTCNGSTPPLGVESTDKSHCNEGTPLDENSLDKLVNMLSHEFDNVAFEQTPNHKSKNHQKNPQLNSTSSASTHSKESANSADSIRPSPRSSPSMQSSRFRHNNTPIFSFNRLYCRYFFQGYCIHGDQCNFLHEKPLCYFFKSGKCLYGDMCRFSHV